MASQFSAQQFEEPSLSTTLASTQTTRRQRRDVVAEDEELARKHFPYEPYYRTVIVEEPKYVQ